jgi:hypothetical protein
VGLCPNAENNSLRVCTVPNRRWSIPFVLVQSIGTWRSAARRGGCKNRNSGTNGNGCASHWTGSIQTEEDLMKKLAIALLAGAGALLAGNANASDLYTKGEYANSDLVQQVRLICNEDGQCYRTRGGRRIIVEDSYNAMPRERYIEQRRYRDWDDGPRAGVGFRAPGVSVGVGVGNDRW